MLQTQAFQSHSSTVLSSEAESNRSFRDGSEVISAYYHVPQVVMLQVLQFS